MPLTPSRHTRAVDLLVGTKGRPRTLILLAATLLLATCQGRVSGAPEPGPVATIALAATAVVIFPQQTLTLTATPHDSAGNLVPDQTVIWTSSQPSVATIDSHGVVTGIASGRATFTATVGGASASVTISVAVFVLPVPPPPPPLPQPPPTTVDTVGALGSWTLILNRPLASKYEGLSFPDAMHGWVVSDQGDILATADSGVTWTQQASGLGPLRSVDFLDANRGFAGSVLAHLYRTSDGGATWTDIATMLPKAPVGFCGITHYGPHVHVVGRYIGATDYYTSPDAGATWQYTNMSVLMSGLVDVAFVTDSTGFMSGTGPTTGPIGSATILKTTDGGATWRTVFAGPGGLGWAWKIFPVTANVIYVSLESEDNTFRVVKSVDGGETWTVEIVATGQVLNNPGGLQGIGFLDINVGWVGGFFTGMFATTNGGLTWSPVPVTSGNVNRFRLAGNTLITAGTKGVLRYDPPH
jgi:photosystem II stability/assembly factor-like uncharacterized protein